MRDVVAHGQPLELNLVSRWFCPARQCSMLSGGRSQLMASDILCLVTQHQTQENQLWNLDKIARCALHTSN